MNPLLVLFGLDIGLLALAYWAGSLLGLMLVMGLCFAVALGLIVFSTAAPEPETERPFDDDPHTALGPYFSSFATLER
ncbi:MAG TPA: hypothetical protein VMR43_19265 [Variovorax sp.]|nr:hypothetical protein [Variovorax sp.]